jgi:hypothetical protein
MTGSAAPVGSKDADTGIAYLLDRSTDGRELKGMVSDFQIYNRYLTQAEADSIYQRSALRAKRLAHRTEHPVTLADQTSGFVGPWEVGSGTWAYDDDGSRRRLVNVTDGWATVPADQAFGVAVFGSTEAFGVFRITNGASANVVFNTAGGYFDIGVEYEVFIARRVEDSRWAGYIRGGAYTSWTLVSTGTDATHTTSRFIVADLDADDTLSDVIFFPYGSGLTPNDIPALAD